jgi:hypothetical protein
MGEQEMAKKAKDFIQEVIEDDSLTDIEKLDFLNYLKVLADVVLTTVLNFYEGENEDGR